MTHNLHVPASEATAAEMVRYPIHFKAALQHQKGKQMDVLLN